MLTLAGCRVDLQSPPHDGAASTTELDGIPSFDPTWYTIRNDAEELRGRIIQRDRSLAVRPESGGGSGGRGGSAGVASLATQLVLVGEVPSPVVDGHVVQASDIDLDPSFRIATVAYGTAGPDRAGALQVIDYADPARPRLLSEVLFHGADVHAVVRVGSFYYVGVARDGQDAPAAIEELRTFSSGVFPTGLRRSVPSHAVTDLAATGTHIAATCGDANGGVSYLARQGLVLASFAPMHDLRAVAVSPAGELFCVAGGATAHVSRWSTPALVLLGRTGVAGYAYPETKGTIEVFGSYSYLGTGDGGFQVLDADGALLDRVDNPVVAGLAPDLAVTNAVSIRTDLAFLASGACGVRVVDLGRWNPAAPPGTTTGLTVLGSIDFSEGISSNMVKARGAILLVAAGTGGVKIVRLLESAS